MTSASATGATGLPEARSADDRCGRLPRPWSGRVYTLSHIGSVRARAGRHEHAAPGAGRWSLSCLRRRRERGGEALAGEVATGVRCHAMQTSRTVSGAPRASRLPARCWPNTGLLRWPGVIIELMSSQRERALVIEHRDAHRRRRGCPRRAPSRRLCSELSVIAIGRSGGSVTALTIRRLISAAWPVGCDLRDLPSALSSRGEAERRWKLQHWRMPIQGQPAPA